MRIHHFVRIPQATVNSTSRHSHQTNVVSVHSRGGLSAATSPPSESLMLALVKHTALRIAHAYF
jgi:hypothetical protein